MTVPCAHCGLPAPEPAPAEASGDTSLAFCCPGCRAAYHAISAAGLQDFYAVRDRFDMGKDARPAVEGAGDSADVFETESFIAEHTVPHDDGTVSCDIHLDGVHCAGCVWLVERMPHTLDGVHQASLNLPRARLSLRWNPDEVGLGAVARWLGRFGYAAYPLDAERTGARDRAERRLLVKVGVAWALAGNVMLLASALYVGLGPEDGAIFHATRVLSGLLAFGSIWFGGREFFRRAIGSFQPWRGWQKLSIDVPISLGILVGFLHSTYAAITGVGEIWYDSIAVLIAALLTARWLQMRGRRAAGDAAERLLSVLPTRARRIADDGTVEEVVASSLAAGDILEVRLGDVVPADGEVVTGRSSLQRAVMTGESRPEPVAPGAAVHAGETNIGSIIKIRVTAVGESTRLGRLLEWVESSGEHKAPVVHLADKWSGIFVAAILVAAAITGVVWTMLAGADVAVHHVVALLVISCPCALGMATPLAMTVGMGRAARAGIFIKHEDALELLGRVDVALFDKTGTITEGEMEVEPGELDGETLRAVAAIERVSNHPIARAFARWDNGQEVDDVEEIAGHGIVGTVGGRTFKVGSTAWLDAPASAVDSVVSRGLTPLVVEVDGTYSSVIGVGDALRPEAADVLNDLRGRGIETYIVSGDRPELVTAAAAALGLPQHLALGGRTPEQKLSFVEDLRAAGKVVAMVGDGVNDSGALKASDVGIAVAGGTEVNYVAADVFLTRPGLSGLTTLWNGADSVMHVVRRNLTGSLAYNVFGITFAALGLVSPLFAAVAMPMSSVSVVLSSLIGKKWESDTKSEVEPDSTAAAELSTQR